MKTFTYKEGLTPPPLLLSEKIDNKRFYLTPNGNKLPSITTVLSHFEKPHINRWKNRVGHDKAQRISTSAAGRGTSLHKVLEYYLSNNPISLKDMMPNTYQAFCDIKSIIDQIDNIHYLEIELYSEELGIAGKCDCIAEYDGVLSVIDFKTSSRLKKDEWITNYFEQATGYAEMYKHRTGINIEQIIILISVEGEPNPQIFIREKSKYMESLRNKIATYKKEVLCS